jgi:hypothetical protein
MQRWFICWFPASSSSDVAGHPTPTLACFPFWEGHGEWECCQAWKVLTAVYLKPFWAAEACMSWMQDCPFSCGCDSCQGSGVARGERGVAWERGVAREWGGARGAGCRTGAWCGRGAGWRKGAGCRKGAGWRGMLSGLQESSIERHEVVRMESTLLPAGGAAEFELRSDHRQAWGRKRGGFSL